MHRFPTSRTVARRRAFAVATAVLCLALLALLCVVQVAHTHATANDADHCQLCILLHGVAPAAVPTVAVVLVHVGRPVLPRRVGVYVRFWHASLFIRPPPTAC